MPVVEEVYKIRNTAKDTVQTDEETNEEKE